MQFDSKRLTIALYGISRGKEGIRQTLSIMRRVVRQYQSHPAIFFKARSIVKDALSGTGKDFYGQIKAVQQWVRDNIAYVKDPVEYETLITPDKLLLIGQGDCDDKAMLLAALLESLGHPTRFVAVGFEPGQFEHVYVQTRAGNGWLSLETTEPVEIGWSPTGVQSAMIVNN